jgi:hypothetical protein
MLPRRASPAGRLDRDHRSIYPFAGPYNGARIAISAKRLAEMVDEATVDTYGEVEQLTGWFCTLENHLVLPFETVVLGDTAIVEKLDQPNDTRIVAVCRRGKARQAIDLLDLPLPSQAPEGTEWIEAYRSWRSRWSSHTSSST